MTDILSVLKETRVFPPPPEFGRRAHIKSLEEHRSLYRRSVEDPEGFWGEQAAALVWSRRWDKVLEWDPPFAKWFVGGALDISENCLDRHVATWRKNKAAILWRGSRGRRAPSPTKSCSTRSAGSPTSSRSWGSGRGTGSASKCP